MIRRLIIGLTILGVLALAALELASERRVTSLNDQGVVTETTDRDARLPVASELEEGAVRPVVTR
ncbi:MAG: hypothetical protein ACREKS_13035 [Candidatus Rokuibacteriota bacterium]